ncbi:THAP-type domain-containing protein [Aphis craccivora]|uniref:THAP-type domain-containing protein n=1 Tax=Aphis craccivora TaxID=307492 RepID=A0A6G0YA33_APHCR|nr:THAP-type domain-containing protein [Aphis craccivora]
MNYDTDDVEDTPAMVRGVWKATLASELGPYSTETTSKPPGRRISITAVFEKRRKMVGRNTIVQVDESLMRGNRKSSRGRLLGANIATENVDVNEKYTEWLAYKTLETKEYIYKTVNHSKFFVDPINGAHTQRIESLWRGLKLRILKKMHGTSPSLLPSYLAEQWWRLKNSNDDIIKCFLRDVKIIDEIFGFLNSRTPYGKGFKQPICKENIIFKENRMNSHITYLYSLKTIDGVPLWKSQRKTFIIGFATSIKSIINISKDLLVNHGFKFVLTYKFRQDAIELFFGHMRGRFGSNNNPNCLQFTTAIKSILLHTSITLINENCNLLSHEEDSLFSI